MSDQSIILWSIGIVLTVLGLAGLLLPVLPGAPLLFAGLFCAAWAEDFRYVGVWTLSALAVMAALTYLVEFFSSIFGAKKFGGSRKAMTGAAIGGAIGIFLGIPGIILGPFLGAVLGELSQQRTLHHATRAGIGTVVGMALGVAGKLAIGIAMVGLFVVVRLF
ncbi:DUF456 domain-containing protein [Geomonas sp. RF6]|uniref:DUF456 domain-containing protein n=1 Tax=Geomonas sp. RF6 TaxID=2897342 RepID=UPI001E4F17D7|nr:DUF456 domain-containing protein [Geomonas sp. RF6]UFS70460.1 DUF456 domain-containing protein [Geomonas sp. RF6]